MPIYEYACSTCDHRLDALQKMSDEPLVDCPSCGEPGLQRMLSAPRFRLKGQGWYETDFKKDKQRNIAGDKEPPKADGDKADTGKTEAAKAEPAKAESTKTESKTPAAAAKTGTDKSSA